MRKIFLDENRNEALLVCFKKSLFEDDFPERGMRAWLTKIEKQKPEKCYKLYFDFEEFYEYNKKYFTADYYDKEGKPRLTAIEIGLYPTNHKYTVYFGDTDISEEENEAMLHQHLDIIKEDK